MYINIQSIHFEARDELKKIITKRLNKLNRVYKRITEAEVFLRLDKNDKDENKVAEIKLYIPNNTLFSTGQSTKFEKAFDKGFKSIRRQLKKHKERGYSHPLKSPLKEY